MKASTYLLVMTLVVADAKILRNNALITKMVSNFHKDVIDTSTPDDEKTEPLLRRMLTLLCHNFPTIPCEVITQDETLRKLIEKSIQQINYNTLRIGMAKTTPPPTYLSLFPIINNEEVPERKHKKDKHSYKERNVYKRKKMRKFYPHKVKLRDKAVHFGEASDEKLSMSVEMADAAQAGRLPHKAEREPVWRVEYMKPEEPSANTFGFEGGLEDKIIRPGQTVIVSEPDRKDVMRPDVYIKKNKFRRNNLHFNDIG